MFAGSFIEMIAIYAQSDGFSQPLISIDVPEFYMKAGQTVTKSIVITSTHDTSLIVDNVSLKEPNNWIEFGVYRTLADRPNYHYIEIPVTVTVPADYDGNARVSNLVIDSHFGSGGGVQHYTSLRIFVDNNVTDPIPPVVISAIVGAGIIGSYIFLRKRKRGKGMSTN